MPFSRMNRPTRPLFRTISILWFTLWVTLLAHGIAWAAVFGEGALADSDYDDRIPMGSAAWNSLRMGHWVMGGGTIHCDGSRRGSAVILETESLGPDPAGMVLATAAHVFFDLETGRRFDDCVFHYLGLNALPSYSSRIDLSTAHMGRFDPTASRSEAIFGQGDWAFVHAAEAVPAAASHVRLRPLDWRGLSAQERSEYRLGFLAWSARHDTMSVIPECRVIDSRVGDLGGGGWVGQLLDNCDSGPGASGGGLVAVRDGVGWLVGVRSGSHHDGVAFPLREFPDGPPDGSAWGADTNTNFARAIDGEMLAALKGFLEALNGLGAGS
jgi:hypothetical protein